MFLLRDSGLSLANMEMFIFRLDSGDLQQYKKLVNMKRDWINIENHDIRLCDTEFLNRYSKVLFEQDFFVFKKKSRTPEEVKVTKIVNQHNTSNGNPFILIIRLKNA